MVTEGNHVSAPHIETEHLLLPRHQLDIIYHLVLPLVQEVEKEANNRTFTAYNARWNMPTSQSNSTLFYSFEVGPATILMLGSYT